MLCTARYCHSIASDCLSVIRYRYRAHMGWNSSKIISRPNSLGLMRWLTPTWCMIWCNGNTPKITVEKRWGPWVQEHIKAVISPKWCKIGPRLLYGLIGSRIRAFDWHQNQ